MPGWFVKLVALAVFLQRSEVGVAIRASAERADRAAMLGKAVGDLHDAHRLARGFGPGVGGDPGAVGVGLEGGSGGAHRVILARSLVATPR